MSTNQHDVLGGWCRIPAPGECLEPSPWPPDESPWPPDDWPPAKSGLPTAKAAEMDRGIEQAHVMMQGYEPRRPVTTYVPLKEEVMTKPAHDAKIPFDLDLREHWRLTDDHWRRTYLAGPLSVRITATVNSVDFETCPNGETPVLSRYARIDCGEERELEIPRGFRLWLRKAPFPRSAECVVEKCDARFPERYREDIERTAKQVAALVQQSVHVFDYDRGRMLCDPSRTVPGAWITVPTDIAHRATCEPCKAAALRLKRGEALNSNRMHVTREWWRAHIEGPCDFTISELTGRIEFMRRSEEFTPGSGMMARGMAPSETPFTGDLARGCRLWLRSGSSDPVEFTLTENPIAVGRDARVSVDREIHGGGPAKERQRYAPPLESLVCGCGQHDLAPGADPYREHTRWLVLTEKVEDPLIDSKAVGIGVSSREEMDVRIEIQHWDSGGT